MSAQLRFAAVSYRYPASAPGAVLDRLSFEVAAGELVALIGPNGVGKTTLLNLACGTLRPVGGAITLDGTPIGSLSSGERARRIALVPQSLSVPFSFTVREFVGLGRTPYARALRGEQESDRLAIEGALARTDTARFAERSILDLSGGERQRVILALALAQEPDLLLLDEPTANLDIAQQVAILELLRELNQSQELTVIAAVHDVNLAALGFRRIIALGQGRVVADGSPDQVLTAELVESIYGSPVTVIDHPVEPVPLVVLRRPKR